MTTPATTPDAPAVVPAPAEGDQTVEPVAPENTPEAPTETKPAEKPEITPEIKALIDAAFAKGREKAAATAEKSIEEKVAEVEAQLAAVESRAINAIVAGAAKSAHDPAVVAKLVDLSGLTSADADAIESKVAEFLTANAYLVKGGGTPAPVLEPAPGVDKTEGGVKFLTPAQMEALTVDQLRDPDTMKLYQASKAHYRALA